MADSVKFGVTCTPVEEIGTEETLSPVPTIIASEVGKSLSGNGEATLVNFNATAANQGYTGGVVNYKEAPDGASNEVAISGEATASFVFIKNTGYVFSSATVLGDANSTRLVKVTTNSGAITISVLDAGEAIILKGLQSGSGATLVASDILIETVDSDGSEAAGGDHLAVEYLVVD